MKDIFNNVKIDKKMKIGGCRYLSMIKLLFFIVLPMIISATFIGCRFLGVDFSDTSVLGREDVKIWKNTPAWELAKAVRDEDINKIKKIAIENPQLLNSVEPVEKSPLIRWCVGMEKYDSLKALLENGADPNIATIYGKTALYEAAGFSWIDTQAKQDAKYVKLLLQYGADPNIYFKGGEPGYTYEPGNSPLIQSIGRGIDKTKALVDAGADINHKTTGSQSTAVIKALDYSEYVDYSYYLIVNKKANVKDCYYLMYNDKEEHDKKYYPVDSLRLFWLFGLDSPEYKKKIAIIKEFKRQGVDYWKTEIPKYTLETIKEQYPNTWKEYIKEY